MQATEQPIPVHHGHWLWKSTFDMLKSPLGFFENTTKAFAADSYYAKFATGQALLTANPELVKHVLQTNQKNYPKDRGYDQLALLLGKGLVTSRGELWRKQRRIAQPAFYKKSLVHLYDSMTEVARDYIAELRTKEGQELDISQEMMKVTARVVMKSLFSAEMKGGLLDIYNCISYAQEYTSGRIFNPFSIPFTYINGKHRKFRRYKRQLDGLLDGLVEERKASGKEQHDFLQMLLDARYEDTGEPMKQRQLLDELVTIFSAGHETSANGLTFILYQLSRSPEVVAQLREEIETVIGHDRLPDYEDIGRLLYTRKVIEEGMRLYPPVWTIGRYARKDDEWRGNPIRKNTVVIFYIYYLHRHPELWEDPDVFDPERFAPDRVKARPKLHYLPFGAGPRMCIGNHFAMAEMILLLPLLIREFDFVLTDPSPLELQPLITLRPKNGLRMKVSAAKAGIRKPA